MFENTLINIFYHTLGCLGTVVSLFWMYLIVKKSPVEMKLFKWVLFRLALCDECFSLGMAVLLLPELCFPVPAGAVHGIAGYFGDLGAKLAVSFVFFSGVNIFTAINGALLLGYVYNPWISIPFVLIGNTGMALPLSVTFWLSLADRKILISQFNNTKEYEYIRYAVGNDIPLLSIVKGEHVLEAYLFAAMVAVGIFAMYFANFLSAAQLWYKLQGVKSSLSEKTFKAHQQMLMMIVAQNIYPLFGIMIPVLTFVVSYAIDQLTLVSNAFYKHTFLVLLLIYPLISFCCCVAFMKPYRDFCFPCFAAKVEDSREPTRSDTDDAIRRIEERRGNFLD
ncbi:unnamed protein product, partial [Mesorhabditis spiculigera]